MEEESKAKKEGISFSMRVKEELSEIMPAARHCQLAELTAFILFCGRLDDCKEGKRLLFESENESVIRKYFTFLQKTFNIELMRIHWGNGHVLELEPEETEKVLQAVKLSETEPFGVCSADGRLLAKGCCRRAFVRGCFLASGSISAPQKGYHFEIVTTSAERAAQVQQMMRLCAIEAKTVIRKKYHVVYAKEGEQIADLLSLMGASRARMEFENIRILKDVRNSVNRKVNCEAANISKTASAAVEQIEDIQYISRHYGLGSLPENLKQAAHLRLEKPDASLTELGRLMDPPVSKSGVNHRMKKLRAIADQIREKKEEDYDNKKDDC